MKRTSRRLTCGYECSCPSRLYHDVRAIMARYDAPIPPPSREWVIGELQDALNTADEDYDADLSAKP